MSDPDNKKDELVHPLAKPFLWLDAKWLKSSMIWVFGILTLVFIAADFLHTRHDYIHLAEIPGFYAYWGFGAFVLAVMIGWFAVRALLERPEDYWDEEGDHD